MSREIKFRGRRVDNLKWVYGHFYHDQREVNGTPCVDVFIIRDDCDQDFEVRENSIGEYTGLKDKNGKEIYEGDIVRTELYESEIKNLLVFFHLEMAAFSIGEPTRYGFLHHYCQGKCEVIGNIYENPELLPSPPKSEKGTAK